MSLLWLLVSSSSLGAPPAPPPPVTDADIADALAGRYGPVLLRYRYEWRTIDFEFVADITNAFEQCAIQLDNNRAIVRAARFEVRRSRLPADFNDDEDHVAVWADLAVRDEVVSFPMGLFIMDQISERISPQGEVWTVSAADVGMHLFEDTIPEPYSIPADSLYVEEAERVIQELGLRTNIAPSSKRTPTVLTWPPGTARGRIANDLMEGINYYSVWADKIGQITSRERVDPSTEQPDVLYTTADRPRMIQPPLTRVRDRGRYLNHVTMFVATPSRPPVSIVAVNNDDDSPISTVNKGAITATRVNADRVWDLQTMIDIGVWRARDASVRAQTGSLTTHPDPRRDAHETYTVEIEGYEERTLWRCEGWQYDTRTDAAMSHRIGRADHVDVEVTVCS